MQMLAKIYLTGMISRTIIQLTEKGELEESG